MHEPQVPNFVNDELSSHSNFSHARSVYNDMSSLNPSRHDATGSDILRSRHSSHSVVLDNNVPSRVSTVRTVTNGAATGNEFQVENGARSIRRSRSVAGSEISAVTSKLGSIAVSNAIKEEEEELEREMEAKKLEVEAEGLVRRAKLMRKHNQLLREASQAGGSIQGEETHRIAVETAPEDDGYSRDRVRGYL